MPIVYEQAKIQQGGEKIAEDNFVGYGRASFVIGIIALVLTFPVTEIFAVSSEFSRFSMSIWGLGFVYSIIGAVISQFGKDKDRYSDSGSVISIVAVIIYAAIAIMALATR